MPEMSLADLGGPNGVPRITVTPADMPRATDPWASYPIVEASGSKKVSDDPWSAFPIVKEKAGVVEDVAKSIPSGLAKGAAAVVGLPELLDRTMGWVAEQTVGRGINAVRSGGADWSVYEPTPSERAARVAAEKTRNLLPFPSTEGVVSAIEDVTGPLYKPETRPGRFAQTASEFAAGTLLAPGGSLIGNGIRYGVVPGLTSEAAGQATEGSSFEPAARFAGAMGGAGIAGLMSRPGSAAQTIRAQLPENVTPQMVDQAERLMQDAARQGVQLSWPEALSRVAGHPVLTNTMRHLEAAPQTEAQMAQFFAPRPGQIDAAGRNAIDSIGPANLSPSSIGPSAGREAAGIVGDGRQAINRASDPFYRAAEAQTVSPAVMAQVRAAPGWEEARAAVRNDPQLNRYVSHLPDDSVGFLNEVKKFFDTAAENAAGPVNAQRNMQRSAGYDADATVVRNAARATSPEYGQALDIQSFGRERYLQPLLDGPIGKLAQRDQTTRNAINALFPTNPLPNSAREISMAVGALAQRNPRVASDLVRAHVESAFNEATQALQSGANQAGGAKFWATLVGNAQQRANLEAAIRALPQGDQRWRGVQRFLDVAEATGTRQNIGSRTSYNTEFLKDQSQSRLAVEGAKAVTNPVKGVQFLADRYERWKLGSNLGDLARIFTDPRSGNLLRAIANMPVNSRGAQGAAVAIANTLNVEANRGAATR